MGRKILFLDLDGVLNSKRSAVGLGGRPFDMTPEDRAKFDPCAIGMVRYLQQKLEVEVVLSSTWRDSYYFKDISGWLGLEEFVDQTPTRMDEWRGYEIKAWLDEHGADVEKYAILDDIPNMLDEQEPYFVQTNDDIGFSYRDFLRLRMFFEGSMDTCEDVNGVR